MPHTATSPHIGRQSRPNLRGKRRFCELSRDCFFEGEYSILPQSIPSFKILDSKITKYGDISRLLVFLWGIPFKKVRYIAQMPDTTNIDELIQEPIKRVGIYMPESTHELAKKHYESAGCKSVSDYICKAIHYYSEVNSLGDVSHIIPDYLNSTLKDIVRESDNKHGRLLFKIAVELAIMQNVVAAKFGISPQEMDRLRGVCVNEVKKINGTITFDDAVRWQS